MNKNNPVHHPAHYNQGKIEVIEVIEDWKLNFRLGTALKYIGRCKHTGRKIQDLKKAIWYLNREIDKCEERISSKKRQA